MNNEQSKKIFLDIKTKMNQVIAKYNISQIVEFYMSVLEHKWVIIVDANNAHDVEKMCIDVGISSTSTVKIVPMTLYDTAVKNMS